MGKTTPMNSLFNHFAIFPFRYFAAARISCYSKHETEKAIPIFRKEETR
jgi:hypothetical protein